MADRAARRKQRRKIMTDLRSKRAVARSCRQCDEPRAVDSETGLELAMCRAHLDADAARKRAKPDV